MAIAVMLISGCQDKIIKPGSYTIENKNERPIYLIDINSGERLMELKSGEFFLYIPQDKKIASFIVEITNFNTQSSTSRMVELGFFNGKAVSSKKDLPLETQNTSDDAIIILPDNEIMAADTDVIIGVTLSSYGPTRFTEIREGYCYFYIGVNHLKVAEKGVTPVKKPESIESEQVFEGDLAEFAGKYLPTDMRALIDEQAEPMIDQKMINNKGILVYNRDLTRELTLANREVIIVSFFTKVEEGYLLAVYLDANDYSFLGIKKEWLDNGIPN